MRLMSVVLIGHAQHQARLAVLKAGNQCMCLDSEAGDLTAAHLSR
jgi:hypothetical protein